MSTVEGDMDPFELDEDLTDWTDLVVMGATDTSVLAAQTALRARGFDPGKLDGVMGPNTAAAIRGYQASVGMPQTGVVDTALLASLASPPSTPSTPAPSSVPVPQTSLVPAGPTVAGVPVWKALLGGAGILVLLGGLAAALGSRRK